MSLVSLSPTCRCRNSFPLRSDSTHSTARTRSRTERGKRSNTGEQRTDTESQRADVPVGVQGDRTLHAIQ
jgi:hypothetical protein